MAIAIRGTTPATTSGNGATVSITLTGAQQPQAGDVLLIIHCNDFYALTNMPTPTVAGSTSGVTATGASADAGTNLAHIKSYTYVVGSSGDLTVAVTETGAGDEEKALIVYVLSGADTTTPVDVAVGAVYTLLGISFMRAPSVSPTSSDAYLICHTNNGPSGAGTPVTPPTGMAETYDLYVTSVMATAGAVLQLSASGATGVKDFDTVNAVDHVGISVAIKTGAPAAAPPTLYQVSSGVRW